MKGTPPSAQPPHTQFGLTLGDVCTLGIGLGEGGGVGLRGLSCKEVRECYELTFRSYYIYIYREEGQQHQGRVDATHLLAGFLGAVSRKY